MGDSSLDGRERLEKLRERLSARRGKNRSVQEGSPPPPQGV